MDTVTYGAEQQSMSPVILILYLAFAIFEIVALWKLYSKAGQPGWAILIPIYDLIVLFKIVKMEWWHVLILLFVPLAACVYGIILPFKLAKVFGKGTGFGVLTLFFSAVTIPILAFGSAKYEA